MLVYGNNAMKHKRIASLSIVPGAFLLTVGCHSNSARQTGLPPNAPTIGKLSIAHHGKDWSNFEDSTYTVMFPVCNRKAEMIHVHSVFTGDPAAIASVGGDYGFPHDSYSWVMAGEIQKQRKKTIYLTVQWKRGNEKGTQRFTITPAMDGVERTYGGGGQKR